MSIDPIRKSYNWNYSNPNKEGYSTMLVGTVVNIQEVQAYNFSHEGRPTKPRYWDNGDPVMNLRIILATDTEPCELKTLTFPKAGKEAKAGRKPSLQMDLWHLTGDTYLSTLIGKTIVIETVPGSYGLHNPRPWKVALADEGYGPFEYDGEVPAEFMADKLLADEAVHGGQVQAPQQQAQPQQQPRWQQQQPQWQPRPIQQQPQQWPPHYPQTPQYQPQPQRGYPPQVTCGQSSAVPPMDPAIMQQMAQQAFGPGVQVSQVQPPMQGYPVGNGQQFGPEDYDADIPI